MLVAGDVLIWLMSGAGYFWPIWPGIAVAALLGVPRLVRRPRERQLETRVDELTRTRAGAVDVQASELRRIERDLHDGAQARLVALSMHIGRVEERLAGKGADAGDIELLRQARHEATAAIAELRDLARGISPPVLADRGLGGGRPIARQIAPLRTSRSTSSSSTARRRRSRKRRVLRRRRVAH